MITDPRFAPKRNDLTWLRRRRLPKSAAAPAAAPTVAPPQQAHAAVTDFVSGRATRHEHPSAATAVPPAAPPRPAAPRVAPPPARAGAPVSSGLDLDAPATPVAPSVSPPAPSGSSSLDLDEPVAAPVRAATPPSRSASLDLDEPAAPPPPAAPVRAAVTPDRRVRADVRVKPGERALLTVANPSATLTRLQSGIGTLTFEAACSPAVGDLRIGCAYELSSGASSTVQLTQGNRVAPPRSRRPVLVAAHERFETIAVDLRQCTDLRRLVVYAFSEGRAPLTWGGTLITTTFGGARVELPLESLQSGDSAVLLSLYNVRGEFVLRAEMQTLFGDVREACRTYGFDRITWLDDRTPVE